MKLQSIQALRGLAALLVAFAHLHILELKSIADNGLSEQAWTGGLLLNGYAGVDLFFVISGFIMVFVTRNTGSGPRQAADFLFARVTRIYPVWWAFAGCMTIYVLTAHGFSGQSPAWLKATNGQPMIPYLVKSFLLIPQPAFPILNVGWTLVHEVYFYFVFTLFLLLPRRLLPFLLAAWATIVITGTVTGYSHPAATTWISLALHPMTLEFILGAATGLAVTNGLIWRSGVLTLVATLWLFVALCYHGEQTPAHIHWGRVLWYGLPAALMVYAIAGLDIRHRHAWLFPALIGGLVTLALYQMTGLDKDSADIARRDATLLSVTVGGIAMLIVIWFGWLLGQGAPDLLSRIRSFLKRLLAAAVKLGDWSFSLYLCHLIVLSALRRSFEVLGRADSLAPFFRLGHPGALDNVLFAVIGMVLTITASWLSYRMYEHPLTILFGRLRKVLFRREPPETAPA
nr:acyltransferase [uncultured Hyphomonas sp.]